MRAPILLLPLVGALLLLLLPQGTVGDKREDLVRDAISHSERAVEASARAAFEAEETVAVVEELGEETGGAPPSSPSASHPSHHHHEDHTSSLLHSHEISADPDVQRWMAETGIPTVSVDENGSSVLGRIEEFVDSAAHAIGIKVRRGRGREECPSRPPPPTHSPLTPP
jgi:hypothetical protein